MVCGFDDDDISHEVWTQQAQLQVEAAKIKAEAELERLKKQQEAEITHQKQLNSLEVFRSKSLTQIEAKKFSDIVESIGPNTIKAMAEAGPAQQAKLLQSLGLKSFMITDGNTPINLFNTAQGLITEQK